MRIFSLIKFVDTFSILVSLKLGKSFKLVKLGIVSKTSFLNKSKFSRFLFLFNFLKIKLNILQSSKASPIG